MGSFEGEIGQAAFERAAQLPEAAPRSVLRRVEDAAIENIGAISIGVSASIILLAAAIVLQVRMTGAAEERAVDPIVSGSITPDIRPPPGADWQSVRNPPEIISLTAPQFGRATATYAARRSSAGDREDSLTFVAPDAGGAEARIALVRQRGFAQSSSLFVTMTRQQAERGIAVTRAGRPDQLPTKFGLVEVADMMFNDASGTAQACLGFRSSADAGQPAIAGWYCAAHGGVAERPELTCFIDRLTMLKSGEDQALRRFFTEAEQRRKPCPTTRQTAGRKPTWLDHDGRVPAIRGSDEVTGSIGRTRR
jgi:hypothetical protein